LSYSQTHRDEPVLLFHELLTREMQPAPCLSPCELLDWPSGQRACARHPSLWRPALPCKVGP